MRTNDHFIFKQGIFRFEVMPFGLTNAPATFQHMMNKVLEDLESARIYLDDVVTFSSSLKDHLHVIEPVIKRIKSAGLKIKPKKCYFVQRKVNLLGHIVDRNGVHVHPEKFS